MGNQIPEISVVVPTYQEEDNITEVLERLTQTLGSRFDKYQIIIVADGCQDRTAEVARTYPNSFVEVHEYFPNQGKGYAIKYGVEFAQAPVIAFCDGDLDIHPDSLLVFYDLMKLENAKVVVGAKSHPNSIVNYPYFRRIQSWIFRQLINWKFDLQISDTQTGLKIFETKVLLDVIHEVNSEGFSFDLELLVRLNKECKIIEGPVWLSYQFTSTVNPLVPIQMIRDVYRIARALKKRNLPQ
jgi:glycosyltransferase involved in cell wall biosynthesis